MSYMDYSFNNTDEEYKRIRAFVLENDEKTGCGNTWDVGRLDWWRYNSHGDKATSFFQECAHYWTDESGKVVGLFISEYGNDDFFVVADNEIKDLDMIIIDWGIKVWSKKKDQISTFIFETDSKFIDSLSKFNFSKGQHDANIRYYDLNGYDFDYELSEDYQMMRFKDYGNYESRVEIVRNAFGNKGYNISRLKGLQSTPTYQNDLELVIVDSSGVCVGYCIGWVDELNATSGYIEPMGVHTDHRKKGLGTALAKECFKRLNQKGVLEASIVSLAEPNISNYLYESLKPKSIKRTYEYKRINK